MKKIFLAAVMVFTAFCASAQINVLKNGMTLFGYTPSTLGLTLTKSPSSITDSVSTSLNPYVFNSSTFSDDSIASAIFYGRDLKNKAYINFGPDKHVYLGAIPFGSRSSDWMLRMYGEDGMRAQSQTGDIFICKYISSKKAMSNFVFTPDVQAPSFITSSDARLKSNIESLDNTSSLLAKLNPVSYTLTSQSVSAMKAKSAASVDSEDEVANTAVPDDRVRYGFLAQELREIFPNLVVEDEDGTLGIDYIGLIPVMVDAIKELQETVSNQQEEIATLSNTNTSNKVKSAGTNEIGIDSVNAYLAQNKPNPFKESTVIRFALPETVGEAYICIYDLQGKQLIRKAIADRGEASLTIEGSSLEPGMYIYALIADGAEIANKRMIITD
jgi:hypothetical protein